MKIGRAVSSAVRRGHLWATVHFKKSYQPVGDAWRNSRARPDSAFTTRLEVLEAEIRACDARNMLDIGCAEGFFLRQASLKYSMFCVGIDALRKRMTVGAALAELKGEEGYGFVPQTVTPEKLLKLPKFDVVLCYSVLHHVIKQHGREEGLRFLQACRQITNKVFLFDMGGPDEVSQPWAKDMAFLKGDVAANTRNYLLEAGFAEAKKVGESPGYRSVVMRPIFSCKPPASAA